MTSPTLLSLPNALRRKLLLSVNGGLALATPLGMLGCGGSDAEADASAEEAEIAAIVRRLPVVERRAAKLVVTLPKGAGVALADTRLITTNNVSRVSADGTAGAVQLEGAAQMAYLVDSTGRLLLMGVVEPGAYAGASVPINAHTTAAALILNSSVTQCPRRPIRGSVWVRRPVFARRCSARGRTIAGVWSTAAQWPE